jgi:integral membrane sensor domain MASE1
MERPPWLHPRLAVALQILGLAVAYYLAAQFGLRLALVQAQASPFWPPTGISLVALLVLGVRVWPGIFLGQFAVEMMALPSIYAVPSAAGKTLACLAAYFLLRRVGFRLELDRLKDALALVFLAAFAAMLISATAGAGVRFLSGAVPAKYFWTMWLTWWTGDAVGVLMVVPLLLALLRFRWHPHTIDPHRLAEATLLLVGSLVVCVVEARALGVFFLAFPFLGWAALRFGLAGTAPVALIASVVAMYTAVNGYGPFADEGLRTAMVTLQLYNGSVALGGLLLAVTITERDQARSDIDQTATRLGEVLNHLGKSTTTPHVPKWVRHQPPDDPE